MRDTVWIGTLGAGGDAALLLLAIVGPVMVAYGLFQLVGDLKSSSRRRVMERLKSGKGTEQSQVTLQDLRKTTQEAGGTLAGLLGRLQFTTYLQRVLEQGNVNIQAPKLLVNLTLIASILMAALMIFGLGILTALGAAVGVFVLPVLYLIQRRRKRMNKFVHQLPDVFELLGQALRAGHSLASGMQLIATEMPDPAGTEFGRVFHEQNLGLKIEDAMRNLADRTNMLDVRFFVTAVLIQRQTGGDLAEVLDKISGVIRDRIKLFGTVQALTAEGRLSGYVLLALPVVVFLILTQINPDYTNLLLFHPTGQMMLTVAITMMLMGWAMIKKIVNIKV